MKNSPAVIIGSMSNVGVGPTKTIKNRAGSGKPLPAFFIKSKLTVHYM